MATEAQPTVMAACRLVSEETLQRCQTKFYKKLSLSIVPTQLSLLESIVSR